jgi:hypothetical protein
MCASSLDQFSPSHHENQSTELPKVTAEHCTRLAPCTTSHDFPFPSSTQIVKKRGPSPIGEDRFANEKPRLEEVSG